MRAREGVPAHARIKRVRLPLDTRTVDNEDEVEESEDYERLRDRVRRGPLREVLLWTILVAGAVWVVLNAIVQIRFVWFTGRFASVPSSVFIWAQAVAGIANSVFLVALGSSCDGAFIRLHPLSSRTVWNSLPRRRVQMYR
jgi:hypothetical protein